MGDYKVVLESKVFRLSVLSVMYLSQLVGTPCYGSKLFTAVERRLKVTQKMLDTAEIKET